MIRSIDIANFRCFKRLKINECARLNIIVGDNGTGKTSLLEAMFLALATSTEVAARLRQQRGLDGVLGGAPRRIEEGLWGDFFYNGDMRDAIRISLSGDGLEARSLEISRGLSGEVTLPFEAGQAPSTSSAPVVFTWVDANKQSHSVMPRVSAAGLTLPDTGEDNPDFFHIAAGMSTGSVENAGRFSDLSKLGHHRKFVHVFTKEYDWITDLNVEVHAGAPAIFATLKGSQRKFPVTNISSAINRVLSILLVIASRPHSIVLVDEIETGIYYTHLASVWRAILSMLREFEGQLFTSTHSHECLEALTKAAGKQVSDISLWRTERRGDTFGVKQFGGDTLRLGIEYGEEVR